MDTQVLSNFEVMGARLKMDQAPGSVEVRTWQGRLIRRSAPVSIDIRLDDHGEYFHVRKREDVEMRVLEVKPSQKHLLLMAVERAGKQAVKSRYLCGHDERSWFVAALPENRRVTNIQQAKDALKPQAVWDAIQQSEMSLKDRDLRRNKAFIRQGEWFFLPRPRLIVSPKLILKNEPIRRGSGKPHLCQEIYRIGGETVYVNWKYPNGLTEEERKQIPMPEQKGMSWTLMRRDARVYARGAVRHLDHQTVWLRCWHQVVMNTETESRAMQNVAFLD